MSKKVAMNIRLNPSLDADQLAQDFAKARRIQIRDILELEAAERLYRCLAEETPWLTAYRDGSQDHMVSEERLKAMTPKEVQALQQKVWRQARDQFEFMYSCYPLMDDRLKAENPDLFLYQWIEYVNSEEVLAFFRKVTGLKSLIRADGQGTWYRKGQFLTLHNDYDPSDDGKRVAYVLSFSREWRPDWGGFLQFYDDDFNIEAGFMPRFNAISMFETPQNHSVTYVTPFCGNRRLAITGWFRDQ
ncbi:MAG: 2OG-Fe(II) oxygenase [Proteobacteria bacterium]|nr:2OG-Fe(II) oxygenase [Pseudomonadota bacterium]